MTMQRSVAMDAQPSFRRIDAAIHFAGLAVRVVAYAVVAGFAAHYECGQAILTGIFVGDLAASAVAAVWRPNGHLAQALAELALLGLVYLWARAHLTWPDDAATRAIIGLSAFGVFAGRAGGGVMTRLGTDDSFA